MRNRDNEVETQTEGEPSSMQEAQHGTRSRVSRIMPWVEDGAKPLSHPGCPNGIFKQNKCKWSHLSVMPMKRLDQWIRFISEMKALLQFGVRGIEQERDDGGQRSEFLMLLEMVLSLSEIPL